MNCKQNGNANGATTAQYNYASTFTIKNSKDVGGKLQNVTHFQNCYSTGRYLFSLITNKASSFLFMRR